MPGQRRIPLHLCISVVLTSVLLLTSSLLGLFAYRQASNIILSTSDDLFANITRDVRDDIDATYGPIRSLLNLLAVAAPIAQATLPARLALLPSFSQALQDNPNLASLYVGYSNGDFFMVRPMRLGTVRASLKAPPEAAFQVWSIERQGAQVVSQALFYDEDLQPLGQAAPADDSYDPRQRPWYDLARQTPAVIDTSPYLFYSDRAVGTTLAKAVGADSVLGADLTLAQLSATLARHKITPGTQIALYDNEHHAVAYPEPSQLITEPGTARLADVGALNPALAALMRAPSEGDRLSIGDRQWIVAREGMSQDGPAGLKLALMVPEDELLADAYRIRWESGLISLAALLFCLPVGWLTARLLSVPLNQLSRQAHAIRAFDWRVPIRHNSVVLEVDRLMSAVQSMKGSFGRYFDAVERLCGEPPRNRMSRFLLEASRLVEADAGVLYMIDEPANRVVPTAVLIGERPRQDLAQELATYRLSSSAIPSWLQNDWEQEGVEVSALGFDEAKDLQRLFTLLDSPRMTLSRLRLQGAAQRPLALVVLLHRDTGVPRDNEAGAAQRASLEQLARLAGLIDSEIEQPA